MKEHASNTHTHPAPISPLPPAPGQAKLSSASHGRVGCGWDVDAAWKLSVQCGNVWLGPDTQIRGEVLGPEGKEQGEGPEGKEVLSLRALKSKKHPRPKLPCPRVEMLLSLNLAGRMSNTHEGEEGSRRMAKPHGAGPGSSRGGRRAGDL